MPTGAFAKVHGFTCASVLSVDSPCTTVKRAATADKIKLFGDISTSYTTCDISRLLECVVDVNDRGTFNLRSFVLVEMDVYRVMSCA